MSHRGRSDARIRPALLAALFLTALLSAPCLQAQFRRPGRGTLRGKNGNAAAAARNAAAAVVANSSAAGAANPPGPALDALIPVTPEGATDAALRDQVRSRLANDVAARNRQRAEDGKQPLPESAADQPRAMIDMAHFGNQYGQYRFFALHLLVENPTAEPLTILRADITAKIDGETKSLEEIPDQLKHIAFPYGTQHHILQNQAQVKELKVPAQGVGGAWLVYPGLPMNADVPTAALSLRVGARLIDIDVTESQRAMLGISTAAVGPRGCLGLLTIHGMLNSMNVQSLIQLLEQSTEHKTVRFVLEWKNDAVPPEQQLIFWLVNSAMQFGSGRPFNEQFPSFPALIREFHIVQPAGHGFPSADQFGLPNLGQRLHQSTAEAVSAALKSAYLALPADELLQEIQRGHPLARAAALRHGAGKLPVSQLPMVLRLIDDPEVDIQTAAVRALSHFSEPAALETLVRLARKSGDPLSMTAMESLAGSRYAVAQTALLELLEHDDPALKTQLMQVLARTPRPQWSESIYEYVTDRRLGLTADGVRALLQVGHPRLVDVLEAGLTSSDKPVRDLVFPILAQRTDVRSERLATDYVLAQLAQNPPDGTIIQFLYRTKLAQAVPLLMKHLETAPDKDAIINLLAQIGDETAGDAIAGRYEKLQNHEKSAALNGLRILRHAKFRELAGDALLSNESSMFQQATQGLMQDGSPEACRLLITALEKQTNVGAWHNICNVLGNFGSPAAREALIQARSSDNPQKKTAAINGLNNFYQRSPGYQYIWQAQNVGQQKNWKEALEYYEMSLQIDPELPEAHAGLGCMKLRLGKTSEAVKDLEKAYELDPHNHLAIPGLAQARVVTGKVEEGLKTLEGGRERYQHDGTFLHSSGQVYALAAVQVGQQPESAERDQRRAEYRRKAVADIQLALSRGFSDFDWLRDDPDLKTLQDDPDFMKLLGNRPPAPAVKEDEPAEPADADPEE